MLETLTRQPSRVGGARRKQTTHHPSEGQTGRQAEESVAKRRLIQQAGERLPRYFRVSQRIRIVHQGSWPAMDILSIYLEVYMHNRSSDAMLGSSGVIRIQQGEGG